MTNEQRADIAAEALRLVNDESVCDLLANLMHYCDQQGFDFDGALNNARVHFAAEQRGEG